MKQLKINKWHNLEKKNGTGFNTVKEWALTNTGRILTYKLQDTEISEDLKMTKGFWFYSVITKRDLNNLIQGRIIIIIIITTTTTTTIIFNHLYTGYLQLHT